LMTYVGPAAAIFAVVAVYRSSCTRPKRVAFYLLNVAWGDIFVVVVGSIWVLAYAQDMTAPYRSNQSMKPTAPFRNTFSVFAATPCCGLFLFR
jgi:hypothetical protein